MKCGNDEMDQNQRECSEWTRLGCCLSHGKFRVLFTLSDRIPSQSVSGLLHEYNTAMSIKLKGLSREQVTNLLPEGLISLCWRGSVAHGMHVPKSDPDSIDDKDVMGIYIAPIEHYLGFGRRDVYEKWEGEWDCVFYELRKFIGLLLQCNPNVLSLLWLIPNGIIYESVLGQPRTECQLA